MNQLHKRRLIGVVLGILVLSCVSALVLYALRQNISLFYTPSQLLHAQVKPNQVIRVGGMVVKGSLIRSKKNLNLSFQLTDLKENIRLEYAGVLPDLFREGQGIVAIGKWVDSRYFKASEVLAKHDEKYMPPGILEKKS